MALHLGNLRFVITAVLSCCIGLTVTGLDRRAEAVITHVSDPAPLGKISAVVGDGWVVGVPQVRIAILDNGLAGNPGTTAALPTGTRTKPVAVLREESQVLTCELPGTGYRVAALQVREDKAWSRPFFVNRARIDWLSTDQAAPGDTLRALGRNLVDLNLYARATAGETPGSHGGYVESDTRVVMRNGDGEDVSCTVVKASAYDVHFRVPDNLPDGQYTVYLHNGLGGPAGWSLPQTVKVAPRTEWPTKVFNVGDFGVKGIFADLRSPRSAEGRTHGMYDDSDAFEAALKAAGKNGGGVVYIPAGSYMLTRSMTVPKYTVLKGESRERSWIWYPDGIDHGSREQGQACKVGFMGQSHFGFENLSIHGVYSTLLIAAPLSNPSSGGWKNLDSGNATQVFVRNCYVFQEPTYRYHYRKDDTFLTEQRMGGPDSSWGLRAAIALKGDHLSVTDCIVKGAGMPVMFVNARHSTIARNRLFTGTAANGLGIFLGREKCVIEDNEIRPGTSRNHSGMWFHHTGSRYYVARNDLQLFWVCDVEGILFHGNGGEQAILTVQDAGENSITCKSVGPARPGFECIVIKGKGLGQKRKIARVSGNTLTLDRPWDVSPDPQSRIVVLGLEPFNDNIVVDNRLEDIGAGIHLWGAGTGWMIDGNHLTRSGGVVIDTCSIGRPWSGAQFMQVVRNIVDQGRFHGHIGDVWTTGYSGTGYYRTFLDGALANVGHVFRDNLHKNDSGLAFWIREYFREGQKPTEATTDVGLIVEQNCFQNCQIGIDIGTGVSEVLKDNLFDNVDESVRRQE